MSTDEDVYDYPLLDAVLDHNLPSVNQLILNGENVHQEFGDPYDKDTILHLACDIRADPRIAKRLIDANVNVNIRDSDSKTPLHIAAKNQNAAIVRMLIEEGAEIDAVDVDGYTPLTFSITDRHHTQLSWNILHCESIRLLIDENADVMHCTEYLSTPLHVAAASGQRDVVVLLIKNGAVIDALDIERRTPLNQAIRVGEREVVYDLLELGASPNQCNNDDLSTPLHQAAIFDNPYVIYTLVDHGADLYARDTNGRTPLEVAISYGHQSTVNNLNEEIDRLERERIKHERKLQVMMGNTEHENVQNNSWLKVLDLELMRKILDEGVDFDSEYESDDETVKIDSEGESDSDSNSDDEFEDETEKIQSEDESHNDSDEEHISNNWHDEGYDSALTGASNDSWHQ